VISKIGGVVAEFDVNVLSSNCYFGGYLFHNMTFVFLVKKFPPTI